MQAGVIIVRMGSLPKPEFLLFAREWRIFFIRYGKILSSISSAEGSMTRRQAELVLLGLTAIWGISFPLTRQLTQDYTGFQQIALRFSLSTILVLLVRPKLFKVMNRHCWKVAVGLGFVLWASYLCQTLGMRYTTSARGGFITSLNVVFVPLISTFLLRERLTGNKVLALVLAVAGLVTLGLDSDIASQITQGSESDVAKGDLLILGCALLFAFHIVLVSRFTLHLPVLAGSVAQMLVVSVLGIASLFLTEGFHFDGFPQPGNLLFLSIVATAFVFIMQISAQRHTGAVAAGIIFSMEPVFATYFGWLISDEPVTKLTWVAGLFMVMAFLISVFGEKKHAAHETREV